MVAPPAHINTTQSLSRPAFNYSRLNSFIMLMCVCVNLSGRRRYDDDMMVHFVSLFTITNSCFLWCIFNEQTHDMCSVHPSAHGKPENNVEKLLIATEICTFRAHTKYRCMSVRLARPKTMMMMMEASVLVWCAVVVLVMPLCPPIMMAECMCVRSTGPAAAAAGYV